MRVFLSYAAEDRKVAEQTYQALRADRHHVFFDRTDLAVGDSYHLRIRDEVARANVFVFFISSHSLSSGSYARTELGLAAENPSRRRTLIPVRLEGIPFESLPSVLSEISVLEPQGDIPAEVVAAVHALQLRHDRSRASRTIATALALVAAMWGAAILAQRMQSNVAAQQVNLVGYPQPGGWLIVTTLAEPVVRQILYRIDGEGAFQSTGESAQWFQNQFKMPLNFFAMKGPSQRHRIEIQYVDIKGKLRGPFAVDFDPSAAWVAHARATLPAMATWTTSTNAAWQDSAWVFFSLVLSFKNAYDEVRYSFDDTTLSRQLRFTRDSSAVGTPSTDRDEITVKAPKTARSVAIKLDFVDGTSMPVHVDTLAAPEAGTPN